MNRRWSLSLLAPAFGLLASLSAGAQESPGESGDWAYHIDIYLWGAGIDGRSGGGNEVGVGFQDILDNLDLAFMGAVSAENSQWSWFADLIYLSTDATKSRDINLGGMTLNRNLRSELDNWITTLGGGYALSHHAGSRVELTYGLRYISIDSTLTYEGLAGTLTREDSGSSTDGVIGIRGRHELAENWSLSYLADMGAGGSDLTWQALLGLNYHFSSSELRFGYRHLDWEFDDTDAVSELSIDGPYAGLRFSF